MTPDAELLMLRKFREIVMRQLTGNIKLGEPELDAFALLSDMRLAKVDSAEWQDLIEGLETLLQVYSPFGCD